MKKELENVKKLLPELDIIITGDSGVVTIKGMLVFHTSGPQTETVLQAYLMGLETGIILTKK